MRTLLFAIALGLLFNPAAGSAHSTLTRSEPKSGAVLPQPPNELKIWFSEPVKVGLTTVEVRDGSGKQVDEKNLRADAQEKTLVRLALRPNLPTGTYKVTWIAVAQDMHVIKGAFEFKVSPKAN